MDKNDQDKVKEAFIAYLMLNFNISWIQDSIEEDIYEVLFDVLFELMQNYIINK